MEGGLIVLGLEGVTERLWYPVRYKVNRKGTFARCRLIEVL